MDSPARAVLLLVRNTYQPARRAGCQCVRWRLAGGALPSRSGCGGPDAEYHPPLVRACEAYHQL